MSRTFSAQVLWACHPGRCPGLQDCRPFRPVGAWRFLLARYSLNGDLHLSSLPGIVAPLAVPPAVKAFAYSFASPRRAAKLARGLAQTMRPSRRGLKLRAKARPAGGTGCFLVPEP